MRRLFVLAAAAGALSCSPKNPSSQPTPVNPPPAAPPPGAPRPSGQPGLRLGPSVLRYIAHQSLHAEQQLQPGQTQVIERGTRLFLTATIVGPADSSGYRLTFTVDSIALDSGTTLPPNIDLTAARGLVYDGRLSSAGVARITLLSDSTRSAAFVQLLGLLRTFYPRLPREGLVPGAEWTDTTAADDRAVIDVTRRSVNRSRVATWEDHGGIRALRLDVTASYTLSGKGTQANQPVEVSGAGIETTRHFVAADGRYLGAEDTDSSTLSVTFPYQSVTIPAIRVLRSTVIAQP